MKERVNRMEVRMECVYQAYFDRHLDSGPNEAYYVMAEGNMEYRNNLPKQERW